MELILEIEKKFYLNLTHQKKKISEKFNLKKISLVVLLQGITKNDDCVKNRKFSNFVNIDLNKKMINDLVLNEKPFIFFSTEWVYPGTKKFNSEKSIVLPANLYARQKLIIEKYIKKKGRKIFHFEISKNIHKYFKG